MIESMFWGAMLRVGQALASASPFILTGLFVAAVLRRFFGTEGTRSLFGGNTLAGLFKAWAIGMLLPVCSLGVIPVMRQMKRAGISGGTILAFALAAPLFNPLSLMYGLTLSKPLTILIFSLLSLVVITVAGAMWDSLCRDQANEPEPDTTMPKGIARIASMALHACREMAGVTALMMAMGLFGVFLLALALKPGSLQNDMGHDNPLAPLIMSAVAVPAYASPMTAMGQLGSMFQHGNSVGAAFILLSFGAGMNLGMLWWMGAVYGPLRASVWVGIILSVVLVLSYAIERPLYPKDIEPANHTHAFDIYCRAFENGAAAPAQMAWEKLKKETQPFEVVCMKVLGAIFAAGVVLRLVDPNQKTEAWLARPSPDRPKGRFDVDVPGHVLGLVGLGAVVAVSIVGCFAYYPDKNECLEELRLAKVEAFSAAMSGNHDQAAYWIPVCEDWLRRLQVGVYLREFGLSDYHRARAKVFRQWLELIEHEAEEGAAAEARKLVARADRTYMMLSKAFREE